MPLNSSTTTGLPVASMRVDELVLPPDEVEAGAIAHVLARPCLARRLLVAADGEHDDVRPLGDLAPPRRSAGGLPPGRSASRRPRVHEPPIVILHPSRTAPSRRLPTRALMPSSTVTSCLRNAAVAAEQAAIGVRSDDGDGLDGVRVERQHVALVPEQRDRLARCLQREVAIAIRSRPHAPLAGSTYGSSNRPSGTSSTGSA